MKIITHNGQFHTDEVFAVAILKLVYPKVKVIRTRDLSKYSSGDFLVDIGWKYEPEKRFFDHHQKNLKEKRENGVPYSSAGLIWKSFGDKIIRSAEIREMIDKKLIQPIDAHDNGMQIYEKKGEIIPYTIGNVINPFRNPNEKEDDKGFAEAVEFAKKLLIREIAQTKHIVEETKIAKKIIGKSEIKEYLVLPKKYFWEKAVLSFPKIKFVIYPYTKDKWTARAVPRKERTFQYRKLFPKKWRGLEKEQLFKITGVGGAIACHKTGFAIFAKTKEDIIILVEKALKHEQ